MPIMKAHQIGHAGLSAIVMDLGDVELEAQRIVIRARQDAEQLVNEARARAESQALHIRDEARKIGHAEGYAAGLAEGRAAGHAEAVAQTQAAVDDLVARWSATLEHFHANTAVHHADAKSDLVRLALAIAHRVTHQEALRNRSVAESTLAEALHMIGAARKVAVLVCPDEIAALQNHLPALLANLRSFESVELTPDPVIPPGGCVVRFGGGELDARLDTQIQRISDELLSDQ